MNILVTGTTGFVGMNLCESLRNLRGGKGETQPEIRISEILEYYIVRDPFLLIENN